MANGIKNKMKRFMKDFFITSGYNFEGYRITEYLDYCSGECALGTGFLSSLGAGFADLAGTNSEKYTVKLNQARNIALDRLKHQAKMCGANALIGVAISHTAFSSDIMGVLANGTAVNIEKILDTPDAVRTFKISAYNPSVPVRPIEIQIQISNNMVFATVILFDGSEK